MESSATDASQRFEVRDWGAGIDWWRTAMRGMFASGQFLPWVLIGFVATVVLLVASFVPLVGTLAQGWLGVVLGGGLAVAARRTSDASTPSLEDLFAGFRSRLRELSIAGLVLGVAGVVLGLLVAVVGFGGFLGVIVHGDTPGYAGGLGALPAWLLLMLVLLLGFVPIGMAAWLAPALIMLREMEPVEALKASLRAAWANSGALTLYGLVFIGLALVASALLGLGWLVLLPLLYLSTYAAYVDIFGDD
ncbi:MAG TPA: BPSS1780 family membrane protein [Burkholderiaceae bacterium]|nr:BPSS1780 family membrane protein [Burkholderiaceae bacterium]